MHRFGVAILTKFSGEAPVKRWQKNLIKTYMDDKHRVLCYFAQSNVKRSNHLSRVNKHVRKPSFHYSFLFYIGHWLLLLWKCSEFYLVYCQSYGKFVKSQSGTCTNEKRKIWKYFVTVSGFYCIWTSTAWAEVIIISCNRYE